MHSKAPRPDARPQPHLQWRSDPHAGSPRMLAVWFRAQRAGAAER